MIRAPKWLRHLLSINIRKLGSQRRVVAAPCLTCLSSLNRHVNFSTQVNSITKKQPTVQPIRAKITVAILPVLLTLLYMPIAEAQLPATLLPGAIEQVGKDTTAVESTDSKPEALKLNAGWWRYFLNDKKLPERADQFLTDLNIQIKSVTDEERRIELSQQMDLIQASLSGYVKSRTTQASTAAVERPIRTSYTPSELLALHNEIGDTENQIQQINTDIDAANRALASVGTRLDNRFASYLQLPQVDPTRFLAGLEVIADRFTYLLTQEKIRVRSADFVSANKILSSQRKELEYAKAHLTSSPQGLIQAQTEIKSLEDQLAEASKAVVAAKAAASEITGSTVIEQARSKILAQQILNAQIDHAAIELKLMQWKAEQSLLSLLSNVRKPEQSRDDMVTLRSRQQDINGQLARWAEESSIAETLIYQNPQQDDDRHAQAISRLDQQLMDEIAQSQIDAAKIAKEKLALAKASNNNLTILLTELQSQIFAIEGAFKNVGGKARIFGSQMWDFAKSSFNTSLFRMGETPVTPRGISIAILIMLMGWLLSWLLRRFLGSLGDEDNESHSVYYTIGRLGHYTLILLSFLLGLSLLGISLTSFAVVAGALAIGIGFGLQAIVNNFISGLILLFERSLKVGDFIEFSDSGLRGEVKAINVRSTEIKTNDNIDIIVPNSEFMNTKVVNWTLHEPYRRSLYDFRIGFEDDKYKVRETIIAAASDLPYTLTGIPGKGPQVWLVGYDEYAYHMQLAVWLKPSAVKRPQVVNAAFYWAIDDALKKINVAIPVPKREIVIKQNNAGKADQTQPILDSIFDSSQGSPIKPPPPANPAREERR